MELYTYYRSTSSYRVRIALALKGLAYQSLPVNLLQGEQRGAGYVAVNPQGRVPALRTDGGDLLVQSPAIIEYLEEVYPQPALLPATAKLRLCLRRPTSHGAAYYVDPITTSPSRLCRLTPSDLRAAFLTIP